MNIFHLIYEDDPAALTCAVAILYVVGIKMADAQIYLWGRRAAGAAYVIFVAYAYATIGPSRASEIAYIAFRGLFAAGLTLGPAWMMLAIALFCVTEVRKAKARVSLKAPLQQVALPAHDQPRPLEQKNGPENWKPETRDESKLRLYEIREFENRRFVIKTFETEGNNLIGKLSRPRSPATPPRSAIERRRLQTQIDELELARQLFANSGDDPQEVGRTLADIDRRVTALKTAIGAIPQDRTNEPPQLEGIAVYDDAVARRPDNPHLYVARGWEYMSLELYRQTIADCNRALTLLPGYYFAYFIRGCAYHHLRKFATAIRDFKRAIYENPEHPWAYVSLAASYNATGSYREALGPAYYVRHKTPWGDHHLAVAYESLGDHEKAIHHLTRLIEADPNAEDFPHSRLRRAKQLLKLDRTQLATHDLKTHLCHKDDPEAKKLLEQLERLPDLTQESEPTAQEEKEDEVGAAQVKPLDV